MSVPSNVVYVLFSLNVLESVWLIPCNFFYFNCWCSYYCCCNNLPRVANKLHIVRSAKVRTPRFNVVGLGGYFYRMRTTAFRRSPQGRSHYGLKQFIHYARFHFTKEAEDVINLTDKFITAFENIVVIHKLICNNVSKKYERIYKFDWNINNIKRTLFFLQNQITTGRTTKHFDLQF